MTASSDACGLSLECHQFKLFCAEMVIVCYFIRLPSKLVLEWPENDKLDPNSKIPAGTTIGTQWTRF